MATSLITILSIAALSTNLFWLPLDWGDDFALIPLGHGVIEINGDAHFAATALLKGWPGNGSPENPYLIDGLDIDRGGAAGHCIYIKNTRVSFIMRNCRFTGADVSPGEGSGLSYGEMIAESGAGILLYNVANGELVNNTCNSNNNNGIFLLYSRLNTVANNTCNNNGWDGIYLETSDSNTVVNNTCTSNGWEGIGIAGEYNIAANNNCTSNGREFHRDGGGICLGGAYNTVTNNTCTSNDWYGIFIVGDSITVANNTCTSNGWYGIFIGGASNTVANNTCTSNGWYGIFIGGASNTVVNNTCSNKIGIGIGGASNTVANNTCFLNHIGIELRYANSNTAANNICNRNDIGISLDSDLEIHSGNLDHRWLESRHNTVTNNICNENEVGIRLNGTSYNIVENNTCNRNDIGIFLDRKMELVWFHNITYRADSLFNTVADNTCNYNRIGIYLRNSSLNTVVNNTCLGNTEHDIIEKSGTEEIPPDIFSCSDSQELQFWVQDVNL